MTTPPRLQSATAHSVILERLKAAEVRDYNLLMPILRKQINDLLDSLRGTTLSAMTRGAVNARLRLLRQAQQASLTAAYDKLERRLRLLAEYEADFEASTLQRFMTEAGLPTTLATPTGAAAWALANATPLSTTGDLLMPWVKQMTSEEVDQINKVILRGYSEGWTNDQLTTMLKGTARLNYSDGLLTRMGKHNATIVRTAIQHVASTAREQVWRDNEDVIERYRWVSTLDSRTSPQCRTLDGQEFEIGKGPRPPIHPNCRSTTIAIIEGLEHLLDHLTRASADGQVPAKLTYYDWLRQQPASFQQGVLGPSRYKLFTQSGMTADKFAKLQLNSAFQPLALEQLRGATSVVGPATSALPASAAQLLSDYKGPAWVSMARALRDPTSALVTAADRERALAFASLLESSSLNRDITAFRGMRTHHLHAQRMARMTPQQRFDYGATPQDLVGEIFEDASFMSFSLDRATADSFGVGGAVFQLEAKKGSRGWLDIDGHLGRGDGEFEVVRSGGRFKIVSWDPKTNTYRIEVVK